MARDKRGVSYPGGRIGLRSCRSPAEASPNRCRQRGGGHIFLREKSLDSLRRIIR